MTDTNNNLDGAPQGPRPLADALEETRARIRQTLDGVDPALTDIARHLGQSSGKHIRAALLLSAAADDDSRVEPDAVTAAAALEILHLATLVHDDVIDDAPTRRGLPSVQSQFGKKTAVISGDYLFCLCFSMIAGMSHQYPEQINLFTRAISSLCIGELNQHKHNRDSDLSILGYMRIISGKTAALFLLALYAGGLLSGASEKQCRLLGRIGFAIGMLFQLVDDCLDYESTSDTLKKSVKHDIAEGVITLPLIFAMRQDPALKQLAARSRLTAVEIREAAATVMQSGGLSKAREVADSYYRRACRLLEQLDAPVKQQQIRQLLDQIHTRRH
ncbi:MAG: polyprenyl synthetase family protein [Eubacteriales bacterium]|jgi:heptaprenyl diphosphate synthase|nr:polyprenyl synthetase family protein [Eubacteriales bacterium]MDD4138987.1 polyprenyl synthetase family protein [Eubacteriales bacterium]NLO34837.1 polyprenyl synthetase family protein [Clostridiaceae bacterium]